MFNISRAMDALSWKFSMIEVNMIYNKREQSKLSSSRLKVLSQTEDFVEVVAFNFFKDQWSGVTRCMRKDWFFENYEAA